MIYKLKNIFIICLVIMLTISVSACDTGVREKEADNPKIIINQFFKAIKDPAKENLWEVYEGNPFFVIKEVFPQEILNKDSQDSLNKKINEFTYKIKSINKKENSVTVNIDIKSYNLGEKILSIKSDTELMDKLVALKSSDKLQDSACTSLVNKINTAELTYSQSIKVELVKVNNIWKVKKMKDINQLLSAISGNLKDSYTALLDDYNAEKSVTKQEDNKLLGRNAVTSNANILTKDQALQIVAENYDINLDELPENYILEVDGMDGDDYLVHYYEIVTNSDESHTATVNWYNVNKYTGNVVPMF